MSDPGATRPTLLVRLGNGNDAEAWAQFVRIYSPLVFGYLRRCGLQDADAADVMQEVLRTVLRSVGDFDRDRTNGCFRGWLIKVTKSRLRDHLSRNRRRVQGSGDTQVGQQLAQIAVGENDQDDELWDVEYQRCVFRWAADQVRHEFREPTWQAFWQTRVENKDVRQVAEDLNMMIATVYVARGRVMARIKQKVREVGDE